MNSYIRKIVTFGEDVYVEGEKRCQQPFRLFSAAAVIKNPWQGYVDDLKPKILEIAPELGQILTERMIQWAGSGEAIEAYGKAAVVGTSGELEHASALIHTLRFGNVYRDAVGAKSYLSFSNTRGAPNCPVVIPLMHKHDAGLRAYYLTIQFNIVDAPSPDEIVVALGGAIGGRPHHRIGDRYQDIKEMNLT